MISFQIPESILKGKNLLPEALKHLHMYYGAHMNAYTHTTIINKIKKNKNLYNGQILSSSVELAQKAKVQYLPLES